MITLSLSPVFGLGILGVLLLVLIVGLILVRGQAPRMPLPDYDDPNERGRELTMKFRQPMRYRARTVKRWMGVE